MSYGKKVFNFYQRIYFWAKKNLNQPYQARPGPFFRKKSQVESGQYDLKSQFNTLPTLQMNSILSLVDLETFFNLGESDFKHI